MSKYNPMRSNTTLELKNKRSPVFRVHNERTPEEIKAYVERYKEKHPHAVTLSWLNLATDIWYWLMKEYQLESLMPPDIVVNLTATQSVLAEPIVNIDPDEEDELVICGELDGAWWFQSNKNKLYPRRKLIRIYNKGFRKYLQKLWGVSLHITSIALTAQMAHIVIHEMCHYITHYYRWLKIAYADEKSIGPAVKEYAEFIKTVGSFDDEHENETTAMNITETYMYKHIGGFNFIPIIDGSYDAFMRKHDLTYRAIRRAVEIVRCAAANYLMDEKATAYVWHKNDAKLHILLEQDKAEWHKSDAKLHILLEQDKAEWHKNKFEFLLVE